MMSTNGVSVYAYAIIDEVVQRLSTMTPGERSRVATKLVQSAPDVAEALAEAVTVALAERVAEKKPVE